MNKNCSPEREEPIDRDNITTGIDKRFKTDGSSIIKDLSSLFMIIIPSAPEFKALIANKHNMRANHN